jgi:hypothetical protein
MKIELLLPPFLSKSSCVVPLVGLKFFLTRRNGVSFALSDKKITRTAEPILQMTRRALEFNVCKRCRREKSEAERERERERDAGSPLCLNDGNTQRDRQTERQSS